MSRKLKTYSQEDVRKITARDELADGWYRFLITKWERKEDENKPVSLRITVTPLEDPEDPESKFRVSKFQDFPLSETESSGEIDGFRFAQTGEFGALILEGVGPRAVWDRASKSWTLDGAAVDKTEAKEHNDDRVLKGLNGLVDGYNDDSNQAYDSMIGNAVYGCIVRKASKNPQHNGQVFANIGSWCEELPNGARLVPKGKFIHSEGGAAAPPKKAPAARRAR